MLKKTIVIGTAYGKITSHFLKFIGNGTGIRRTAFSRKHPRMLLSTVWISTPYRTLVKSRSRRCLSNLQTVLDVYALMGNIADWYILAKLRSLYDYAIEKGYVSDNLGYRLKSDNNPAGVKLVLSDQEIRDFFMICDEAYTMYSCMFAVALYTGMRIREVMAMAHGQIDRKMGTVKIQSQIKDGKLVPAVKTRRGRKIRLSRTEDVALEEPGMAFNYLKLELKKQANNLGMPKEELMKSDRLIITHPGSDKNTSSHRIHRSTENGIGLGSAGKA